jgi:HEAT repeat protein
VRDARRSALLERLAELAGFQIVGVPRDDRVMSIDRENAPLEQVLSELLVGEPYTLRYVVDEQSGAHRLQRVALGSLKNELARLRREDRMERRSRAAQNRADERRQQRALERELTPEQREQARAQRAADRAQRDLEIASALAAPDPETRARGIAKLDPDDEGVLGQLLELSADPAPAVRASAVSRLALSEAHGAHEALANALRDPDPQVVKEALDAYAYRQDASAIPLITPLLDHPDEGVRNAAADAISFLE